MTIPGSPPDHPQRKPPLLTPGSVTLTFAVPNDVWELLMEVSAGEDWEVVAAKALEAGLEQALIPTLSGRPANWRGS